MKIIHTYVPVGDTKFNKYIAYSMSLSALLAKRHYDNVVLYTDKKTGEIVKQLKIPYDSINTELLDNFSEKTFSIPKLLVYSNQKEPFIHIDLDTFIFDKIEFTDKKRIYSTFPEGSGDILKFDIANSSFFNTYIIPLQKIQENLPNEFSKHIIFKNVPNMSVFGGFNHELISEATKYCLDIYENNMSFFDSNYYNACIIEQLFIPAAIRMILSKNRKKNELENSFKFLFKDNPTYVEFIKNKWDYPFLVRSMDKTLWIGDKLHLFKNSTYNFNGFLHLNGYKNFDELIFILKQHIIQDFDKCNLVIMIEKTFSNEETKFDIIYNEYYDYLLKLTNNMNNIKNKKMLLL